MSARQIRRLPVLIVAFGALAALLSGCIGIKPGTYKLTQPAGIGAVNLRIAVCTLAFGAPPPGSEIPTVACGSPEKSGTGQMLATLMVPVGSTTPQSFNAVPGPGAGATTFTRNAELTAQMNATEFSPGTVGPPSGFELAGYSSGTVAESSAQEFTWTIEAGVGLPPGAGGGSYGGPFKATVIVGWRNVTPEFPASRPINCKEEPAETICGIPQPNGEATLGVSDLKVAAPPPTTVVPGAKVKLPFVLDFASSATELPKFKLALSSKLPQAELSLSSGTFTRGPTEAGTNRAPATTRTAIVQVPETAAFGGYELTFAATAAQGGAATAATTLSVKPKGNAKVSAPKRVKEKVAWSRGIPVKLIAPIAGTRFIAVLKGPRPSGGASLRLLRRVRTAKELGRIDLRMRIPRIQAEAFLDAGATLRLETKIQQPGTEKPKRAVSLLKLR